MRGPRSAAEGLEETMSFLRNRVTLVAGSMLLAVAMLGGSLGVATAGSRPGLAQGFNLIGGPLFADMDPDDYTSCLPDGSWSAIYIWNADNQTWRHYFSESANVPDYVNNPQVGGIDQIPRLAGVVIIMNHAVANVFVPDNAGEVGNCA